MGATDIFDSISPGAAAPGATPQTRLVMCAPKYLSTRIPNNVFMRGEKVNVARAMKQYGRIVRLLRALDVEVLEIPPVEGCQDQTYVANIAVTIPKARKIVLANYKAPGRACEEAPARRFFTALGYDVIRPPAKFEGEADFKLWRENIYFGGWGKFTDRKALDWIAEQTGCQVIPIHETSDELYHLDCSLFIVDEQNFLVNREGMDKASLRTLESVANIIPVPPEIYATGATNCVRVPGKDILLSGMFFPEEKQYQRSMEWMAETFDRFGKTVCYMDIDEPDKSGADISCMVMHLDFEPTRQPAAEPNSPNP